MSMGRLDRECDHLGCFGGPCKYKLHYTTFRVRYPQAAARGYEGPFKLVFYNVDGKPVEERIVIVKRDSIVDGKDMMNPSIMCFPTEMVDKLEALSAHLNKPMDAAEMFAAVFASKVKKEEEK